MKKLAYFVLIAAAFTLAMPRVVWAQDQASAAAPAVDADENGPSGLRAPALAPGHVARYRVTYFNSQTGVAALRSASIVSVTNQNTATCGVSVDWRIGAGGVVCTSTLNIGPNQTLDFCTRAIPGGITVCNAICAAPGLTAHEGSAVVGSSAAITGCERIALSARTVYTQTTNDMPVSAITDAKVVRINAGNAGD